MLIVTAGCDNYAYYKTINYCKARAIEYGYSFVVYDFGNLGFGIPVDDPRCVSKRRAEKYSMKPKVILDAMNNTDEKTVVWIDGDAILVNPIDEINEDLSFDVALTVRPKRFNKKTEYINAGVVFLKNNKMAKAFVTKWIAAVPKMSKMFKINTVRKSPISYCDQKALEEKLILPNIEVVPWDAFNTVQKIICGINVKFLDCERYNNWALVQKSVWKPPGKDVKILHFKGHQMHNLQRYHEEFLV